jgi:hypothetical protein
MSAPILRPLSAGEVLDVSFGIYRAHFVPLVTIAAITRALPDSLGIYVEASGGIAQNWTLGLFHLAFSVVLSMIGVAATTSVVSDAYLGRSMQAMDAVRNATGMLGRLMVVSIGSTILIFAGFILLIFPGLLAMSGLALASVVVVLEGRTGMDALQRSWDLTKGYRRKVLLVIGIAVAFLIVPTMVMGIVAVIASASAEPSLGVMVASSVLSIFIFPFIYVATVVLYYDIRVRKEGFDLELLAADTPAT